MNDEELKPVRWIGSSKKDLKTFPKTVQRDVGQALYASQLGAEYSTVKALKGFGGRSVLEIVGGRYNSYVSRSVHGSVCRCDLRASRISEEIKEGHSTPRKEMELVRLRLVMAERAHRERQN